MNAVEQGEAMQLLQDNYYYFDVCYLRELNITDEMLDRCIDACLKFPHLYYWQIGKIINLDNDMTKVLMAYLGYAIHPLDAELEKKLISYTSAYRLFDGAAEIRLKFEKGKNTYRNTFDAKAVGMDYDTFVDIVEAIRLPYKEQILSLAEYFDIDIESWKATSYDVNAILTDRLDNRIPRTTLRNTPDLGEYRDKEMIVRYALASFRLAKNMTTYEVAKEIGVSDLTYQRFEICASHPDKLQAQKLALLLGIDNIADVYIARIMPANYEYELMNRIGLNNKYVTAPLGLQNVNRKKEVQAAIVQAENNEILAANRFCEGICRKYKKGIKHAKQ